MNNDLIFGRDNTQRIVSMETVGDKFICYIEQDGKVNEHTFPNQNWALSSRPLSSDFEQLDGNLHYKYGKIYTDNTEFESKKKNFYKYDTFFVSDTREANMLAGGYTYYKGMKPADVSILSFDIETTGLVHNDDSKVLLIANTFRKDGVTTRKMFAYDDYKDEHDMINDWCNFVRKMNPAIICGHNVLDFDFNYLNYIAKRSGTELYIGRDGRALHFANRPGKFRVDGNRDQEYTNIRCFGREIIDTMYLALKYDIKKQFESYGLKPLIKQLGLEAADRTFYDASQIRFNYTNPEEWAKIKEYAIQDGDDSLALFDKFIPAFFYIANSVPKTFQQIIMSASGAQINSFLVRSYLQFGHSIPKAASGEELGYVEGGLSIGIPGIYKNGMKLDLKSAYPSQILRFKLFDKQKDPLGHLYLMTKYFFEFRMRIKELAKNSSDSSLKDQDEAAKAFLNSLYGLCKTPGLNFNSKAIAERITEETRKVLRLGIKWATSRELESILSDKGLTLGRDIE